MTRDQHVAPSRRDFVLGSSAGLAGVGLAWTVGTAAEEKSPGWIDAHVHIWTPDVGKYPVVEGFDKEEMQPKSFTVDELFGHCKPSGVDRVVLIQMIFYAQDHRYMNEAIAQHPGVFTGVALVDWRADDVEAHMERLAEQGSRGFRLHSFGDAKNWVEDEGMQRVWRKADRSGLAVCPLIDPQDIQYVDALCRKYPDVTVVIDHFARVGVSGEIEADRLAELCGLARHPKVHVKTSAFYALGKKKPPYEDLIPMIRRVVDAFGPERLMWASDCPFQVDGEHTYQASISLIRDRIDFLSNGTGGRCFATRRRGSSSADMLNDLTGL